MNCRTDLAIEISKEGRKEEKNIGKLRIFMTELPSDNEYAKPQGKYSTIEVGEILKIVDFSDLEKAIFYCLEMLMPKRRESVLLVGLGNREIISDCIGPFTAEKILATRHIKGEFAEKIGLEKLKSVAVFEPGVLGNTGMEAFETVESIVKKIKPDAVIVIDALCAKNHKNLFSVIQCCDSGISPGSGVKNTRKELSFKTLGVPTVAIGVPTVVEAKSLVREFCDYGQKANLDMLVTPKDVDLLSHRVSEAIATALNVFLQPEIDREIILNLV